MLHHLTSKVERVGCLLLATALAFPVLQWLCVPAVPRVLATTLSLGCLPRSPRRPSFESLLSDLQGMRDAIRGPTPALQLPHTPHHDSAGDDDGRGRGGGKVRRTPPQGRGVRAQLDKAGAVVQAGRGGVQGAAERASAPQFHPSRLGTVAVGAGDAGGSRTHGVCVGAAIHAPGANGGAAFVGHLDSEGLAKGAAMFVRRSQPPEETNRSPLSGQDVEGQGHDDATHGGVGAVAAMYSGLGGLLRHFTNPLDRRRRSMGSVPVLLQLNDSGVQGGEVEEGGQGKRRASQAAKRLPATTDAVGVVQVSSISDSLMTSAAATQARKAALHAPVPAPHPLVPHPATLQPAPTSPHFLRRSSSEGSNGGGGRGGMLDAVVVARTSGGTDGSISEDGSSSGGGIVLTNAAMLAEALRRTEHSSPDPWCNPALINGSGDGRGGGADATLLPGGGHGGPGAGRRGGGGWRGRDAVCALAVVRPEPCCMLSQCAHCLDAC